MSALIGARAVRVRRAVQQWAAQHDTRGADIEALVRRAVESASNVQRDLFASEIDAVCRSGVEAHVAEVEVQRVKRERDEKLERERLDYLARRQADLRLLRSDPPPAMRKT